MLLAPFGPSWLESPMLQSADSCGSIALITANGRAARGHQKRHVVFAGVDHIAPHHTRRRLSWTTETGGCLPFREGSRSVTWVGGGSRGLAGRCTAGRGADSRHTAPATRPPRSRDPATIDRPPPPTQSQRFQTSDARDVRAGGRARPFALPFSPSDGQTSGRRHVGDALAVSPARSLRVARHRVRHGREESDARRRRRRRGDAARVGREAADGSARDGAP